MPEFFVGVREVHVQTMLVEAETEKEAIDKVREGEGESCLCEYSHTLDSETWTAEKAD
jgi:hypothetical protein